VTLEVEHSDVLEPIVAVAKNVVLEFAGTVTPIPGDANVVLLPVPATALVHVLFV
jgi:hypothetical protein